MSTEKHIKCILILNWRTGDVRIAKNIRKVKLHLTDIPVNIDLTLKIPERRELSVKCEVKLSEAQISNIAIDAFEQAM